MVIAARAASECASLNPGGHGDVDAMPVTSTSMHKNTRCLRPSSRQEAQQHRLVIWPDYLRILSRSTHTKAVLLVPLLLAAGLASSDAASTASALLVSASADGSLQRTLEKQGLTVVNIVNNPSVNAPDQGNGGGSNMGLYGGGIQRDAIPRVSSCIRPCPDHFCGNHASTPHPLHSSAPAKLAFFHASTILVVMPRPMYWLGMQIHAVVSQRVQLMCLCVVCCRCWWWCRWLHRAWAHSPEGPDVPSVSQATVHTYPFPMRILMRASVELPTCMPHAHGIPCVAATGSVAMACN